MKNLKTTALAALLFVCCTIAQAQNTIPVNEPDYNKPKIFSDLPEKFTLNITDLESLFYLTEGTQINRLIAANFGINGVVVSKADDSKVHSIVIRSSNRQSAAFTLTRFKNPEGNFTYSGRMFSKTAGDVLVIEKEGANYILRKKNYHDLINE